MTETAATPDINPDHKCLFKRGAVEAVEQALREDLASNIGDTIYVRARTLAERHGLEYRSNRVTVAIAHLARDPACGLAIEESNPESQHSRWTVSREGER